MVVTYCVTAVATHVPIGLRVSSIPVIFVGALLGCWLPVCSSRAKRTVAPRCVWFAARYFGSGVILSTAFIHLLAPAHESLTDPCLTGAISKYPWVEAICLMSIFAVFSIELALRRADTSGETRPSRVPIQHEDNESPRPNAAGPRVGTSPSVWPAKKSDRYSDDPIPMPIPASLDTEPLLSEHSDVSATLGRSTLSDRADAAVLRSESPSFEMAASRHGPHSTQITAVLVLEAGVVFHSIFIGITLAVAGSEFSTLYVVLTLHQTFEGLAIGSRLACIDWPSHRRWTPYYMSVGFALSTPVAIAVGLALQSTLQPHSQTSTIITGVFDSISAGVLMYTALVELIADEFLHDKGMQGAPLHEVLAAVALMALGATSMAILGCWA